jgi:hypothetical protein
MSTDSAIRRPVGFWAGGRYVIDSPPRQATGRSRGHRRSAGPAPAVIAVHRRHPARRRRLDRPLKTPRPQPAPTTTIYMRQKGATVLWAASHRYSDRLAIHWRASGAASRAVARSRCRRPRARPAVRSGVSVSGSAGRCGSGTSGPGGPVIDAVAAWDRRSSCTCSDAALLRRLRLPAWTGEAEDQMHAYVPGHPPRGKRRGVLVSAAGALKEMETFVRA